MIAICSLKDVPYSDGYAEADDGIMNVPQSVIL